MAIEMKIPSVGESITEVTIANWLKKDGDYVERDEIIVELETDKATQEFPAEASGILTIKVAEGETVEIGSIIASIEPSNGKVEVPKAESAIAVPKASEGPNSNGSIKSTGEVKDQIVPQVGESITEVTLSNWLIADGEFVTMDQEIAELESDKATFEFPAEAKGILRHVAKEGDVIPIGGVIAKIEVMEGGAPAPKAATSSAPTAPNPMPTSNDSYAAGHPSPVAAKILAEKGIEANAVKGTGVGGRITKEDAESAQKAAPAPKKETSALAPAAPAVTGSRNQERKKMSGMRKAIARRLVAVKNETAMLTTFNEVDMKPIMDLRAKYKDSFKEKNGVGLGFMSFFLKASAVALKEFPAVNAFIDGDEMIYNDYADIAIAVSTPKGLVVPVIRNAEDLSFSQLEKEVVRLAIKGRDGKLTIPEMEGGTFTITNGGIFGSMLSTPIINAPQSAILGMHNIVERPVALNGQVVIRPIMYLALSYDHRVIDGKESVSFLVRMKQLLEDPARLLLEI